MSELDPIVALVGDVFRPCFTAKSSTVRSGGPLSKGARSFSFQMQVQHSGTWVPCGRCAIPWNAGYDVQRDFAAGTLWEVRYLYATPEHVLYQPRIKGPRDDVAPASVTRAQFRYRG